MKEMKKKRYRHRNSGNCIDEMPIIGRSPVNVTPFSRGPSSNLTLVYRPAGLSDLFGLTQSLQAHLGLEP